MQSSLKRSGRNKAVAMNSSTEESNFNLHNRYSARNSPNKDILFDLNDDNTSTFFPLPHLKSNPHNRKCLNPRNHIPGLIPNGFHTPQQRNPRMEELLMEENTNLKKHNNFLVAQIQTMFDRQKAHKRQSLCLSRTIKQLENLNRQLQQRIQYLTGSFLEEISRIQSKLSINGSFEEDRPLCPSDSCKSVGSKFSTFLDQNLLSLKQKINGIISVKNISAEVDSCGTVKMFENCKTKEDQVIASPYLSERTKPKKEGPIQPFRQSANQLFARELDIRNLKRVLETKESLVTLGGSGVRNRK